MLPFLAYWYRNGGGKALGVAAIAYVAIWTWDGTRGIRCPMSWILAKMCLVLMCFTLPFFKLLLNSLTNIEDTGFWVGFYLPFAMMALLLGCQVLVQTIGHHFIYPHVDSNYHTLRATGFHPIFDRGVFGLFNPDSDLVRHGGFEEPTTNFVPPVHWQFQCPQCGARVEHDPDVCWNCNYGANGDSTAYYERYGHIDPPSSP